MQCRIVIKIQMIQNTQLLQFVRFCDAQTILLASVLEEERETPVGAITHARMEENYRILCNTTDQNGNPFKIIRVPLPPMMLQTIRPIDPLHQFYENLNYEDGTTVKQDETIQIVVAASYLNFLVTNGVVVLPKYYREGENELLKKTDDIALEIFRQVFPGRDIVQLFTRAINIGGGGIRDF